MARLQNAKTAFPAGNAGTKLTALRVKKINSPRGDSRGLKEEDIMENKRTTSSSIAHSYQLLRDDQYLAGYGHYEDDHILTLTFKDAIIARFITTARHTTEDTIRQFVDEYQSKLYRAWNSKE